MQTITEETKKKVVKLHIQDGRTIASLAAEYGICHATVSNWIRAYREGCQTNDAAKSENELMQEVRQLQRKLAEAEKENDFLKKSSGILCEGNRLVAYRFIEKHQRHFGTRWLLKRMGIFPNAYYNYLKQAKAAYHVKKSEICRKIKNIYHEFGGILGHRSMRVFLARNQIFLSKTTVHKYMNKELHLQCVCRRKRPGYKKGHAHKIFPNLLNRNFVADKANQVWCTDFTYIFLTNGSMRYNCTIIDLYDRSVVASETGKWITSNLAILTLEKAIHSQKKKPKNLILHSDQGSQFTSAQFILYCQKNGITQSMSAAGCPYDNAPMERYYNTFKAELINRFNFRTDEELAHAVSEFAYVWYNQVRPHSYNNYRTPYEARYGSGQFRQLCYKIA